MKLPFEYKVVDEIENDTDEHVYVVEDFESESKSEIALCTLSSVNWGKIRKRRDFERICTLTVRALDELLDYQDYPVKAAKNATMNRRPLGIGIINLAYWLAKNDLTYQNITSEGLAKLHRYTEAWSYYLIKASVDLAIEKGACPKSGETKYAQGIMPIDTYKKEVDELVTQDYLLDWDTLRADAQQWGIRNSTLMSCMPAECQSLDNELLLSDGTTVTLETIIKEFGCIDIEEVHNSIMPGQRFNLAKPVELANGITAYECYYNGPQPVTEIELEDGTSYKFTENHKLLVNRNGNNIWVEVKHLLEDDDIVSVNA